MKTPAFPSSFFYSSFSPSLLFLFFVFFYSCSQPATAPPQNSTDTTLSAKRDGSETVMDTLQVLTKEENNEFRLIEEESLGGYYIDMPVSRIIEKEGEPNEKSPFELWGSDGLEHSSWKYNGHGMELWVYKEDDGEIRVGSIFIYGPSGLKTERGIGLGDSDEEVKKQYGEVIDEMSTDEEIIAGSVYGGLKFVIYEGEVTSIFLGAMAE